MFLIDTTTLFNFREKCAGCFQPYVFRCDPRLGYRFGTVNCGCRGLCKKGQCISRGPEKLISWKRGERLDSLSTVVTFVDIGIKVDVRNVTIQNRSGSFDHPIRELWIDAYSMAKKGLIYEDGQQIGKMKTNAIPRIRLIFPGAIKSSVFTCFTIGHINCISPPPSGLAPRFFICDASNQCLYKQPTCKTAILVVPDHLKCQKVEDEVE